jgi:hypothetical protein
MTEWLILIALIAGSAFLGYQFGRRVGRTEVRHELEIAADTNRMSRELNAITNEVINAAKSTYKGNPE